MSNVVAITGSGGRSGWDRIRADEIIAELAPLDGAALPILHALQEEFGCVPKAAEGLIAQALNISRAEVHGIVSFYHDFRATAPGRRVLKLCRAEACQSVGGATIAEDLLRQLGIGWGETTPDGALTVEPVFCLGLCACAPAGMLDEEPLALIDAAALADLARECVAA